jgi:hypothetical protein
VAVIVVGASTGGLGAWAASVTYPPVYHLAARLSSPGVRDDGASFTATLAAARGRATLRWQIALGRVRGTTTSVTLRVKPSGATGALAVRVCPPPACAGLRGTYRGPIGLGTRVLAGLLQGRGVVTVRLSGPQRELSGTVRVAQTVAAPAGS